MKIQTGYLYHIKDEFFDLVNDESLMKNHERGRKRPTYFIIKDENIFWLISLSSKVEKYKLIIAKKVKKYGFCNTILIRNVIGVEHAILLQNTFPTLEKYIDYPHMIDGKPVKVIDTLKDEILSNFKQMIKLKEKGTNLFFTDIDSIKKKLEDEIYIDV